jgi:chaperone required for assembly of F1-ATPase
MASPQKPVSRKRFYKDAAVADSEGGFEVRLDGRSIKTPAGRKLAVPTRALAEAIAGEWNAQGDEIIPATLPLTRFANSAIDGVSERKAEVVEDILNYAGADLVCYRAEAPSGLCAEQTQAWDPVLAWVRETYDAPFSAGTGVSHREQPPASLDAIREAISALDAFKVAALHSMTGLLGSALIALAYVNGFLDAERAWAAAHVDETWQAARWGEDSEAAQRLENRFSEFLNASKLYSFS